MPTNFVQFLYLIYKKSTGISKDQKRILLYHSPPVCFLFLLIVFSSCTSTKSTTYFQDLPKDTTLQNIITSAPEPTFRKGDLLTITVASLSPENTTLYNASPDMEGTTPGYLVDENGNIAFFKLGQIHAEGMTRKALKNILERELAAYLKEPVVAIGYLNRHITLIGSIGSKVLPVTGDRMTLLDAIASSGDIGTGGRKDNILVIRDTDTAKIFKRLDLTDHSIFNSPYFYVQPNDIIYVEPAKQKDQNVTRLISYVTAGITFVFFIIDRLFK
jgi:polysaccharide export outer membrane protein